MHNRKVQTGSVVSNRMDKSIVVKVETLIKHPLYKKYIKKSKKYMAHDPENDCNIGDKVEIIETRPLSRRKRWRLKRIIERAPEL
ncbi:MAG: 30S ribosomal protein S17 [Acidobacteria bacterium]|nr:30S ribosomal protein S17 [Acidobacteriota bacterium]